METGFWRKEMREKKLAACFAISVIALFATASLSAQEKTVIRYTRWAGGNEARDFTRLVAAYSASHPTIEVKTEFLPWAAYWEKVRTTVMSGDAADVISLSNSEAGPYLTRGAFMDLDGMPGARELFAQMQPGGQSADLVNGRIKAIPVGAGVRAMVYNKDLLDKAGIKYPSPDTPMSWDQFFEISRKLSIKQGANYVQYAARFHVLEMYESIVVSCGGRLMDNYTRPTKVLLNSPEGIQGLAITQRLFTENVMPPYTGEWQTEFGTPDSAVATGKIAFMQTGPWSLGAVNDARIKYGTCPVPVAKVRSNRGYINSLAIYRGSKKAQAAWDFITWMTGVEGQLEFTKTGDLPANTMALERAQKESKNSEIMKAFYGELPYVITGPMLPTSEFTGLLETAMTELFQLKATPEQTAARIEQEGNAIISSIFE
jgi:multiple sugar transport system substrate-binding protein